MLKDAGITKEQLDNATWNPKDGGTFEQIAAKLSVDKNGKRGDEPGFDPANVKTYGLALDAGGFTYGQTTWAGFARSLGFQLLNKNPWGTKYNYDDPRFIQTIAWWRHMIEKGYMPSVAQARTLGALAAVQAGSAAMNIDGDWTVSAYTADQGPSQSASRRSRAARRAAGACTTASPTASGSGPSTSPRRASGSRSSAASSARASSAARPWCSRRSRREVPKAVAKHKKDGVDVSAFTSYVKDEAHDPLPDHREGARRSTSSCSRRSRTS